MSTAVNFGPCFIIKKKASDLVPKKIKKLEVIKISGLRDAMEVPKFSQVTMGQGHHSFQEFLTIHHLDESRQNIL